MESTMAQSASAPPDSSDATEDVSDPTRFPPVGIAEITQLAELAEDLLERARNVALEPSRVKKLRKWNAAEVAALLGLSDDSFRRRLKKTPDIPQGETVNGRRLFTLEDIHNLQTVLGLRPRRESTDKSIVLALANFKGGVAKTTSSVHLAQYLCLRGYRVLLIDLDAQASLTQLFGILPHTEVPESQTALPYFEGERLGSENWTGTLRSAIRKTHWHDLDLLASNLAFYGAEFSIASRLAREEGFNFFTVLANGLETVKHDYDVVIMDTAPSLSFVNSNALYAVDGIVITMPPAMMDLQSAGLFFRWLVELVDLFNRVGPEKVYDFLAILMTKMKANDDVHETISNWIRTRFPKFTISAPMLETKVLQKIGPEILTAYEVQNYEGDSRTFERAIQAMNLVNSEIEGAIQNVWRRARQGKGESARSAQP
jgi:chromosome partitioning protein